MPETIKIGIMEELIGTIVIIAIVVFRLVNNVLNKAQDKPLKQNGQPGDILQEKVPKPDMPIHPWVKVDWSEMDSTMEDMDAVYEDDKDVEVFVEPEAVFVKPEEVPVEAPAPVPESPKKESVKKILVEEKEELKEKIDPKKLVIYSEIMNRKY